jgi:hypothetical protein
MCLADGGWITCSVILVTWKVRPSSHRQKKHSNKVTSKTSKLTARDSPKDETYKNKQAHSERQPQRWDVQRQASLQRETAPKMRRTETSKLTARDSSKDETYKNKQAHSEGQPQIWDVQKEASSQWETAPKMRRTKTSKLTARDSPKHKVVPISF